MSASIPEIENLVRRIADVTDCRIETDAAENVLAVHVTTAGQRAPADVRADIVARFAALGMDVLEEQIQLTIEPPPSAELELEELEVESRPRLVAVRSSVSDEKTSVEAELALGSSSALGRAESRGAGSAPHLLAEAVLDALEKLCSGRVTLRFVGSRRTVVDDTEVVTVIVHESIGRETRVLVGAARMDDDVARATAYAALAATNRRLGRILAMPPRTYRIG